MKTNVIGITYMYKWYVNLKRTTFMSIECRLDSADLNLNLGLFMAIWNRDGAKHTAKLEAGIWFWNHFILKFFYPREIFLSIFIIFWQKSNRNFVKIKKLATDCTISFWAAISDKKKSSVCRTSRFSSGKSNIADCNARRRYCGGTSMKIVVKVPNY